MRHPRGRVRLGLLLILAGLASLFVWDAVYGQGFPRPPIGGMPGQPPRSGLGGTNVGGGGIFGGGPRYTFTCSKCKKEIGSGQSMLDGPASCPFCGVRFINGGLGTGSPPPGNQGGVQPANPAGLNPGALPGNTGPLAGGINPGMPADPAGMNPGGLNPGGFPGSNPAQPMVPPQASPPGQNNFQPVQSSSRGVWFVVGIVGAGIIGLLGVGAAIFLVVVNRNNQPRRKPRRRRRRDEDDYDD